jgi:hypothetical protein
MKKVLVVSLCKYELHESEFVRPVLNILIDNCINYSLKNYKDINSNLVEDFDKIILCGTGLLDNDFLNNLNNFNWILNYNGDILGICAGMQILGLVYGGNLKKKTEIGFYSEEFNFNFLGLIGKKKFIIYIIIIFVIGKKLVLKFIQLQISLKQLNVILFMGFYFILK